MNKFDELLAKLALLPRADRQVDAVMNIAFDAKSELDAEFGAGNRYSISLTRLMLRLNSAADRRESVDTTFRVTELLSAASDHLNRRQGKPVKYHQADFVDTGFGRA